MCDLDIKKDWDGIDFEEVYNLLDVLLHYLNPVDYSCLTTFINQTELIRDKQIKEATKNIPSLLKKDNNV